MPSRWYFQGQYDEPIAEHEVPSIIKGKEVRGTLEGSFQWSFALKAFSSNDFFMLKSINKGKWKEQGQNFKALFDKIHRFREIDLNYKKERFLQEDTQYLRQLLEKNGLTEQSAKLLFERQKAIYLTPGKAASRRDHEKSKQRRLTWYYNDFEEGVRSVDKNIGDIDRCALAMLDPSEVLQLQNILKEEWKEQKEHEEVFFKIQSLDQTNRMYKKERFSEKDIELIGQFLAKRGHEKLGVKLSKNASKEAVYGSLNGKQVIFTSYRSMVSRRYYQEQSNKGSVWCYNDDKNAALKKFNHADLCVLQSIGKESWKEQNQYDEVLFNEIHNLRLEDSNYRKSRFPKEHIQCLRQLLEKNGLTEQSAKLPDNLIERVDEKDIENIEKKTVFRNILYGYLYGKSVIFLSHQAEVRRWYYQGVKKGEKRYARGMRDGFNWYYKEGLGRVDYQDIPNIHSFALKKFNHADLCVLQSIEEENWKECKALFNKIKSFKLKNKGYKKESFHKKEVEYMHFILEESGYREQSVKLLSVEEGISAGILDGKKVIRVARGRLYNIRYEEKIENLKKTRRDSVQEPPEMSTRLDRSHLSSKPPVWSHVRRKKRVLEQIETKNPESKGYLSTKSRSTKKKKIFTAQKKSITFQKNQSDQRQLNFSLNKTLSEIIHERRDSSQQSILEWLSLAVDEVKEKKSPRESIISLSKNITIKLKVSLDTEDIIFRVVDRIKCAQSDRYPPMIHIAFYARIWSKDHLFLRIGVPCGPTSLPSTLSDVKQVRCIFNKASNLFNGLLDIFASLGSHTFILQDDARPIDDQGHLQGMYFSLCLNLVERPPFYASYFPGIKRLFLKDVYMPAYLKEKVVDEKFCIINNCLKSDELLLLRNLCQNTSVKEWCDMIGQSFNNRPYVDPSLIMVDNNTKLIDYIQQIFRYMIKNPQSSQSDRIEWNTYIGMLLYKPFISESSDVIWLNDWYHTPYKDFESALDAFVHDSKQLSSVSLGKKLIFKSWARFLRAMHNENSLYIVPVPPLGRVKSAPSSQMVDQQLKSAVEALNKDIPDSGTILAQRVEDRAVQEEFKSTAHTKPPLACCAAGFFHHSPQLNSPTYDGESKIILFL